MPDVMEAPASVAPSAPASSPEPASSSPSAAPVIDHFGSGAPADFDIMSELDAKLDAPRTEPVAAAPPKSAPPPPAINDPPKTKEETPEPVAAQPAEERTPVADESGELPEGVKIETTRSGSKQYVLDENRYNTIQNGYRTIRMAEETLGEPLTKEILDEMQSARVDLHTIESSILSANPNAQLKVLEHFVNLGQAAREAGEIGHDPMMNLAASMPDFLAQRAPQAFQVQANAYLRRILDNAYRATAGKTDPESNSRFAAAQHLDQWVFGKYSKPEQVQAPDPVSSRLADVEAREQALSQRAQQDSAQRWQQSLSTNTGQVRTKVEGIVASILKPVEANYEKFPKALGDTRNALISLVNDAIQKDKPWQTVRNNLLTEARETTSDKRRYELLNQIVTRYEAKAKIVLDPVHNPEVRARLNQGAAKVAAEANAEVARAERAASQRQPSGGGATPQRSVLPAPSSKPGLMSADEIHDMIANF